MQPFTHNATNKMYVHLFLFAFFISLGVGVRKLTSKLRGVTGLDT